MLNLALHFGEACALALYKAWGPSWRSVVFGCRAEQAPNPNSRVLLDDEKDQFGTYRAKLDWQLTDQDLESLQHAYGRLTVETTMRGVCGHRRLNEINPEVVMGASHHIGTTRMHRDPRFGVVNSDCRVHSVRNLFIAGSSVFPTAGWAPPTLTIVALALRLARFVQHFLHAQ
jgi:choline dehydrogenase-like flavoprotein